jgi:hypothetical protein
MADLFYKQQRHAKHAYHGIALLVGLSAFYSCGSVGFINLTPLSDAYLWQQWNVAQEQVAAHRSDLNLWEKDVPRKYAGPDSRARQIEPHDLIVEAVQDGGTGFIKCPAGCDVGMTAAYSIPGKGVYYAANSKQPTLGSNLQYEFVTQILFALGYNTKYR